MTQSISQHNKATKYAHVEDEHCTLRKGATILFLGIVTKQPLTTKTSTAKKVILFWLTSSFKSL